MLIIPSDDIVILNVKIIKWNRSIDAELTYAELEYAELLS